MPPEVPPQPGLLCHVVFTDGHFLAMQLSVRVKTFFTHVVAKIRHVVSKSGLFTHER